MPVWGGRGIDDQFRLKTDHTGIVKADGTTAATALADRIIRIGADEGDTILETTDWSYDENTGAPTIKMAQTKFDEEFTDFEKLVKPKKAGAATTSKTTKKAENGREVGGSSSSGSAINLLNINYGGTGEDGKIPVTVNVGFYGKSLSSRSQKAGELVAPSLEFSGVAAKADIDIAVALLDPDIVDITGLANPLKLLKGFYEEIFWIPAKV